MLPFDQQIQNLNSSQPNNLFAYSAPSAYTFPSTSFPWNMDYSNIHSHSYFPSNNYFFMPNSELPGLDEIKQANQPTRPSQIIQILQNPSQEDRVQQAQGFKIQKPADLKLQQKYGRNIISNIFHMSIKRILSPEFRKLIQKGIQVNGMNITVSQFKERLEEKTRRMKGYINLKAIKGLQIGNPIGATKLDIEFRRLLRILCRVYFHNYHVLYIHNTGKIKKQSRALHLQSLRKITNRNRK